MSSLTMLLQAAEYIERREREAEHGYAQPTPAQNSSLSNEEIVIKKKSIAVGAPPVITKTKRIISAPTIRSSHNELEKNRRAHLRTCLENLKDVVPLGPESSRHTTLGLLTRAKQYIMKLEDTDRRYRKMKDSLVVQRRQLEHKLERIQQSLIMENFSDTSVVMNVGSSLRGVRAVRARGEEDEEEDEEEEEDDDEEEEDDEDGEGGDVEVGVGVVGKNKVSLGKLESVEGGGEVEEGVCEVQVQTSLISGQHYVHRKVHKLSAATGAAAGSAPTARHMKSTSSLQHQQISRNNKLPSDTHVTVVTEAYSPESASLDDDSDNASSTRFSSLVGSLSSDSDDQSSVGSSYGSDGGVAATSRLHHVLQLPGAASSSFNQKTSSVAVAADHKPPQPVQVS